MNGKNFNVMPFFFSKISNKMCYVLIKAVDDVINFKIYLWATATAMADREKKKPRQEYNNLKISEWKDPFRWNKKHFSIAFERLSVGEKWKVDKK